MKMRRYKDEKIKKWELYPSIRKKLYLDIFGNKI